MKRMQTGRVHLVVLGLVILIGGLVMKQWWWQIGLMILIAVVVNFVFWYRIRD